MPTTSNFGWTTPADTDYVKDGANAIRTLANGIDTSLLDLKGGTTGQILSKNSNTDLDYTWINNDQGDITEVTAGTGLTGGGTSGAVTLAIDSTVATLTGSQTLTNKTLTAPKFGTAGEIDDSNGNELIKFPATVTSAVNEITVTNAATGANPSITASGNDTNISLNLVAKGTGTVQAGGVPVVTTTGTQTLTNKTLTSPTITSASGVINNTLTTTTGDIIYASAANTPARLGIGTSGQVLTVSGGIPSWATSSSGAYTLLDSGSLSGTSVAMTSISGSYRDLVIVVRDFLPNTSNAQLRGRYNNESSNYYSWTTSDAPVAASFDNGFFDMTAGANSSTANGLVHFRIYDYANTDTWKSAEVTAVVLNASNAATWNGNRTFVVYNQTTAISRIDLLLSTGSFTSGNYYLYGVK